MYKKIVAEQTQSDIFLAVKRGEIKKVISLIEAGDEVNFQRKKCLVHIILQEIHLCDLFLQGQREQHGWGDPVVPGGPEQRPEHGQGVGGAREGEDGSAERGGGSLAALPGVRQGIRRDGQVRYLVRGIINRSTISAVPASVSVSVLLTSTSQFVFRLF